MTTRYLTYDGVYTMAMAMRALSADPLLEPTPDVDLDEEEDEVLAWVRRSIAWERRLDSLRSDAPSS
jgi:hypothetical protein